MKQKISLLILFIGLNFYAQSTFKKGYIITKDNKKIEVFIKSFTNEIPKNIVYKKSIDSNIKEEILHVDLKELFIENTSKFILLDVPIESLEKGMNDPKNSKEFILNTKKLLLKVLLESSNMTLLSHLDENNNRYLFIKNKNTIELLEYKVIKQNNKKIKLRRFRNYLTKNYKIENSKISSVKYSEKSIAKYLKLYAEVNNINLTEYKGFYRNLKDIVNITPKLGFSLLNQQTSNNNLNVYESEFSSNNINVGLDLEYFFNTFRKKSSIVFSLNYYTNVSGEENFEFFAGNSSTSTAEYDLNMLDFFIKYRYYFYLKNNQFIYTNVGFGKQSSSGNTKYFYEPNNSRTLIADLDYNEDELTFNLGVGYNYNNLSLEINYYPSIKGTYTNSAPPNNSPTNNWTFNRDLLNISIGYTIF